MLFLASLYKQMNYHKRYLINTIFSMGLFVIIFAALFLGYSTLASSPLQYGAGIAGLVVSYYAWTMMMSVYTSTGYIIERNKVNGTMENIIVSSQHITTVLVWESIADSVVYFIFSWVIIVVLALICSIELYFHVFTVFLLLMIGLLSVLGLSLVIAGLEMVLRKMDGIMSLLQFALLGGLFLPDTIAVRLFVPFYHTNKLLTKTFIEDCTLIDFWGQDLLLLLANSALYFIAGGLCFRLALNYAKRRGTLSFY